MQIVTGASTLKCMLGNFSCVLSSADFFFKMIFPKNYFRITIRVSNSLDPDQARPFVGPNLGPACLQRLLADSTSRQRVNPYMYLVNIF